MKLYISGPIKGAPLPDREAMFERAVVQLERAGHESVNPFWCDVVCDCPDDVERTDETRHYNCYLRGDLIEMLACDGLAMLPGWEKSNGARLEHFVALAVGLTVKPLAVWCLTTKAGVA